MFFWGGGGGHTMLCGHFKLFHSPPELSAADVCAAHCISPLLFAALPWRSYRFNGLRASLNWFNPAANGRRRWGLSDGSHV